MMKEDVRFGGILFIVGTLCCARYSFQYFIVVCLMRQPYRYIAAVGHAFVLFDFMGGVLSEVGIGKVWKEVEEKIAVDGFVGIDVFSGHLADLPDWKPQFIAPHAFRNDICIVTIIAAASTDSCIYWIGIVAETNKLLMADATT